jgi:hypothetical protein
MAQGGDISRYFKIAQNALTIKMYIYRCMEHDVSNVLVVKMSVEWMYNYKCVGGEIKISDYKVLFC